MANVIPIGQLANDSECQAIGFLRDYLPDGWLFFYGFEMCKGEEEKYKEFRTTIGATL